MGCFTRFFCALFLVILVIPFSKVYSNGLGAGDFVTSISKKAITVIGSSESTEEKEKNLSAIFDDVVDVHWISKFVLGKYWRESSEAERKQYEVAYAKYLHDSYVPKFKSYTNQEVKIDHVQQEGKDEFLVRTEIVDPSKSAGQGAVFKVDYRIREENGKYKVFDIIAEGISLISTQRSDFSSILSRGGIASLTEKLNAHKDDNESGEIKTVTKSAESGK